MLVSVRLFDSIVRIIWIIIYKSTQFLVWFLTGANDQEREVSVNAAWICLNAVPTLTNRKRCYSCHRSIITQIIVQLHLVVGKDGFEPSLHGYQP